MLGDPDVQTFQNLFWAFDEDGSRLGGLRNGGSTVPPLDPLVPRSDVSIVCCQRSRRSTKSAPPEATISEPHDGSNRSMICID